MLFSGGLLEHGAQRTDVSSAFLYDPGTGRFDQTGPLLHARDTATATRLADGRVLVAGGYTEDANAPATAKGPVMMSLASAELYDPATGLFSDAGSMTTARASHTATLLHDGRVLIAGGVDAGSGYDMFSSAELYEP